MTPAAAPAAAATSTASALPGLGQTMLSLVLVLVVIFALAALLKRVQGVRAGGSGSLRIQAGIQVGAKERVLLIEAAGQQLLIGVAAGSVSTLHVFPESPAAIAGEGGAALPTPGTAMRPPIVGAFAEALKRSLGKGSPL